MSNGPASSASTSCVPVEQVGSASGVSNMARYVGAAVATALAATVYSSFTASGRALTGFPPARRSPTGSQATAWLMAVFSLAGVAMAVVMGRQPAAATGTLEDAAAAASAHTHTLPTSATPTSAAHLGRLTPDRKTPCTRTRVPRPTPPADPAHSP